ncbi:MAG: restriction endonuclease subunit S [Oscillospiraceae bacterium]|nr:restriction endonuclease subunit S [Oscillospiraceae bacterium]
MRKDYISKRGFIPAYSANVYDPFVYTDASNISDFAKPYILWGIDGNLDYNVMPIGKMFATTDHCGAIRIITPCISPYYLAYMLEESKHIYGFDRGLRASLTNMKKVKVKIPIDANGNFDINAQVSIADALLALREVRKQIINRRELILHSKIVLQDNNYSYKYYPLKELFVTVKGFSKYTKKYGNEHTGQYPVYSASSHTPLTLIDTFDYDGKYMTWSTNGFAGTILILNGKFSINGDRGILIPKDGRTDLDFDYMKFTLEPMFREMAKGRKGDKGEDEFTKLYPSMLDDVMIPVPVDKDGNIDLNAQQEIAVKYLSVEQCKKEIVEKLQALITQKVNI